MRQALGFREVGGTDGVFYRGDATAQEVHVVLAFGRVGLQSDDPFEVGQSFVIFAGFERSAAFAEIEIGGLLAFLSSEILAAFSNGFRAFLFAARAG